MADTRSVTEVGAGDFVKVGSQWKEIAHNSAAGAERTPRSWSVRTTDGGTYGMYDIRRYAKREDPALMPPVQPCPRCGRNMFYSDVQGKWMHSEEAQDTACGWGQ